MSSRCSASQGEIKTQHIAIHLAHGYPIGVSNVNEMVLEWLDGQMARPANRKTICATTVTSHPAAPAVSSYFVNPD